MNRKIIRTEHAPPPIGPYNQGVIGSGSFVFTAGQIPLNPQTGKIVEGGIKEQTRQVLENLRAILEQASTSLSSVVKTTVFLKDMKEFAQMNEVYAEFFEFEPPPRTTIEVSRLPLDAKVEIEAIALIENR